MNTTKRKLQVLPEVLPAPTRTSPNMGVRSRTLGHMQRLMAATAALGACTKPLTEPGSASSAPADAAPRPPPSTLSGAADAAPVAIPSGPPTGYMVVDMLPSPARCYGLAASMSATATKKKDATGDYVEVSIATTSTTAAGTKLDPSKVSAWGGTLMGAKGDATHVVISLRPYSGNGTAGASLDVACGGAGSPTTGTVIANVRLSGSAPAVTLMDR